MSGSVMTSTATTRYPSLASRPSELGRACVAAGGGDGSVAARWDGNHWSWLNIRFGDPLGRANSLEGVSCLSQTACAAVGWDDVGLCNDEYSDYAVPVLGFQTL